MYSVVGTVVILAGRQLSGQSIPVVIVARKVLGPLMIILALHLLGFVPLLSRPPPTSGIDDTLTYWLL